ncbi:MAG: 50S ribosomal protein L30 [Acidimicrobiia bacterium]|nr:50S ribosomal protein L30 [Acidimicrobiia bacterium]
MATVRVTLKRSYIGTKPKQRGTLRALGLRKIDQTVEHEDGPVLRGMLDRVPHLVTVEANVEEDASS